MPNSRVDVWLQRLSLLTMLALAVALLGVGAGLVARPGGPAPQGTVTSGK